MNRTSLSLSFEVDGWAENVDLNVDIDVDVEVDADVEVDLVETEVEINVEAAVIVGDEAGQKVDEIQRRSTTMSGSFAFSLWILHSFSSCISWLVKIVANGRMIVHLILSFLRLSLQECHSLLGPLNLWYGSAIRIYLLHIMLVSPLHLVSVLTLANCEPHSRHPASWNFGYIFELHEFLQCCFGSTTHERRCHLALTRWRFLQIISFCSQKTIWNNLELNLHTSVTEILAWHWNHIHQRLLLNHTRNMYFHFLCRYRLGVLFWILIFEQLFDWPFPIVWRCEAFTSSLFLRWSTQIKRPKLGPWILNPLKVAASMSNTFQIFFSWDSQLKVLTKNRLKASASFVKHRQVYSNLFHLESSCFHKECLLAVSHKDWK